MTDGGPKYSLDTSALIDGLERYYPQDFFPALWERMDALVGQQRARMSEEVWEEIKTRDAVVRAWCEPRKDALVFPTSVEVAREVQNILSSYPRLVMNMKNRNRADAFVIAVAKLESAIVVTGEGSDGTATRPKIPFICEQMGVPCIRFTEIVAREGWQF